jgi:putative PIN family toxin of toxin-antitoxin system
VQVVADPNVLVSAVVTPQGVCAELLAKLVESPLGIVVSPLLLDEVERVLGRRRFDRLPAALRAAYIEYLRRITRLEDDPPATRACLVAADPGDDYLVRLTLADSRRLLVTGDRHLLDLAGAYPVVMPRDLLDRLA